MTYIEQFIVNLPVRRYFMSCILHTKFKNLFPVFQYLNVAMYRLLEIRR